MDNIVFISKDENNAIAICKDNYNGVAVQVIRFVDQLKPSGNIYSELVNIRSQQVINQIIVNVNSESKSTFKERVNNAVSESKEFLAKIKEQDSKIDGVMKDYLSQFRGLNEEEE
jgi:hypothetical protein